MNTQLYNKKKWQFLLNTRDVVRLRDNKTELLLLAWSL